MCMNEFGDMVPTRMEVAKLVAKSALVVSMWALLVALAVMAY